MLKELRNFFITGLLVLMPVIATIYVIVWVYGLIQSIFTVWISYIIELVVPDRLSNMNWTGLAIILSFAFIIATGMLATNYFGKILIAYSQKIIAKIPMVGSIYNSLQKISDTFLVKSKTPFKKVVLIQYPSPGIYALGFTTAQAPLEVSEKSGKQLLCIFIPTTPNPTSGVMVMIEPEQATYINMTPEQAIKLIVSGGIINS